MKSSLCRLYVPDLIGAKLMFMDKRILIILFCLVHQDSLHAFCYSITWELNAYGLYNEGKFRVSESLRPNLD